MKRGRPKNDDLLTPREWEVLALVEEGLTNDEIGARLAISPNTVKFHVAEILSKLDVDTREQAAKDARVQSRLSRPVVLPFWQRFRTSIRPSLPVPGLLALMALIGLTLVASVIAWLLLRPSEPRSTAGERPPLLVDEAVHSLPPDGVLQLTICIDNDTWLKPSLAAQQQHLQEDRRYFPWNDTLAATFERSFHVGAGPATGRPNPLGKLILFSGLWAADDSKALYAALESRCPDEPNVVTHPDLVDVWLLGYKAGVAALTPDRVVIVVTPKAAGFQAIQLQLPGRVVDYARPIDFTDPSGKLIARLEGMR